MGLSGKYDKFYSTELKKEEFKQIAIEVWPKNRVETILAMGGEGNKVLDIGCGNGMLLYQFRNSFKQLVGLEYSEHRLQQAQINLADNNFIPLQGSAENMDAIEPSSIELIIFADTIEHIPDVCAAAAEMFRVLKQGGTMIFNTLNIAFIKNRLLLLLGRFPPTSQPKEGVGSDIRYDGDHLNYFTYRSIGIILERVGFNMSRMVRYGKFGYIHNIRPSLMSGGVQWVAVKPV